MSMIDLNSVVNLICHTDLSAFKCSTKIVSKDKFVLGEIKAKLYVRFNFNSNSTLYLHNLDLIFDMFKSDKLFLEKCDLAVNEELFMHNFDEDKIRNL